MQNMPACQYLHGKETVKIYENFFTCSRPPKRPAEGTVTPQGQTRRGNGHAAGADPPQGAQSGERHKNPGGAPGAEERVLPPAAPLSRTRARPLRTGKGSGSTRSPFTYPVKFYAFARSSCAARNRRMPPEKMVERISQIAASAMST